MQKRVKTGKMSNFIKESRRIGSFEGSNLVTNLTTLGSRKGKKRNKLRGTEKEETGFLPEDFVEPEAIEEQSARNQRSEKLSQVNDKHGSLGRCFLRRISFFFPKSHFEQFGFSSL